MVSTSGGDNSRYQYGGKQGYYTDPGTGLLKLGARYYDPTIGRFTTKDPAQDGVNWYAYSDDDPVNAFDPSGLAPLTARQKKVVNNMLDYEYHHGTWATALHFSNTYGSHIPGGTPMGDVDFNNQPITTAAGDIDLDWWTDVHVFGANKFTVEPIYQAGKPVWSVIGHAVFGKPLTMPYDDPKEAEGIASILNGYKHYYDLFPNMAKDVWAWHGSKPSFSSTSNEVDKGDLKWIGSEIKTGWGIVKAILTGYIPIKFSF